MTIQHYLMLSTAHLTQHTACGFARFPVIGQVDTGLFVRVPTPGEIGDQVPSDLQTILERARALGASMLHFDCDAEEIEGLPTYEWR